MRWKREWRCSITDVEHLVFPWHRHTVSEIAVHVKVLVDGDQRSGVNRQNQDLQDSRIGRIRDVSCLNLGLYG